MKLVIIDQGIRIQADLGNEMIIFALCLILSMAKNY